MKVKELRKKLKDFDPEAEVTVNVWDGDYSEENEIDGFSDYKSFVSIQHSRPTRAR